MSPSRHAAVLLTVLAAVTVTGCTGVPAAGPTSPPPGASVPPPVTPVTPVTADATTTAAPPIRLTPPAVVAGELSRRVLRQRDGHPANETVLRDRARAGRQYWVHAACTSPTPGKTLSVEVRSSGPDAAAEARTTVEVPCDGTVTVAGPTELPAQSFAVHTVGDHADVSSGYAVLAPGPSLPGGE